VLQPTTLPCVPIFSVEFSSVKHSHYSDTEDVYSIHLETSTMQRHNTRVYSEVSIPSRSYIYSLENIKSQNILMFVIVSRDRNEDCGPRAEAVGTATGGMDQYTSRLDWFTQALSDVPHSEQNKYSGVRYARDLAYHIAGFRVMGRRFVKSFHHKLIYLLLQHQLRIQQSSDRTFSPYPECNRMIKEG
jgi:hypothetical protein